MEDDFMKIAVALAEKGRGNVHPNPMVGAVIVKNGNIIGKGYHEVFGGPHAEINAFADAMKAGEDVAGSTLYVTLEPCSHFGKTPPCVDKIIEKKIARVVVGMMDPNPLVCGNGLKKLSDTGIIVDVGVLEEECKNQNEIFLKYMREKRPFVAMKFAMSLDGKIATESGESRWISGEKSRRQVHDLRRMMMSIMVGVDTVIKDDPLLTCRLEEQEGEGKTNRRNPIRIIVDSMLRIPLDAKVLKDIKIAPTMIAATKAAKWENKDKLIMLEEMGVKVLLLKSKEGKVDLNDLMDNLAKMGIQSVLLEGGGTLNFSALQHGIVDKIYAYIAPKIIGGVQAKTPVEGIGIQKLKDAFMLSNMNVQMVDEDILIQANVGDNAHKEEGDMLCSQES